MTARGTRTCSLLAAGLYLAVVGVRDRSHVPGGGRAARSRRAAWLLGCADGVDRPMLRRRTGHLELVEGRASTSASRCGPSGGPLPGRATLLDQLGELAAARCRWCRRGHVLRGRYEIGRRRAAATAGRGRAARSPIRSGWPSRAIPLDAHRHAARLSARLRARRPVHRRAARAGGDEGRSMLHRTAGYDLHSIRDFQQGESLRRVHWRSTAQRRKLMVKELTETPRDEAAVVLRRRPRRPAWAAPGATASTSRCARPHRCCDGWSTAASAARW